jgi:hypothetical protein
VEGGGGGLSIFLFPYLAVQVLAKGILLYKRSIKDKYNKFFGKKQGKSEKNDNLG